MSEIIGAVYDLMEDTGVREGILFLDEINCVSETLAPVMLQFLQYKIFRPPPGAGGLDRGDGGQPAGVQQLRAEFDVGHLGSAQAHRTWSPTSTPGRSTPTKRASTRQCSPYLEIKKGDFYRIESTVDGKRFVTAPGLGRLVPDDPGVREARAEGRREAGGPVPAKSQKSPRTSPSTTTYSTSTEATTRWTASWRARPAPRSKSGPRPPSSTSAWPCWA